MAAETAYIMLGHGSEKPSNPASPNIVPHGCTLVVEVHSGELGYYDPNENLNSIFSYKNKKIFLDPIGNYKELVTLMKHTEQSFAIYKSGDVYPNFKYYLLAEFEAEKDHFSAVESGIIKYPFNYTESKYDSIYGGRIGSKLKISVNASSDIITNLFRMSVLPTEKEVDDFFKKNKYSTISDVIKNDTRSKPADKRISSLTDIFQKDLFDKLGPGVYYNFVCRETSDSVRLKTRLNPVYRNSNINRSLYPIINPLKPLRIQPGYHTNFKPAFKISNRPNFNPNYKYVEPNYTKRLNYQQLLKSFLNKQESLPNKSNYVTKEKIKAFINSRKKHKFFIPEVRQLIEEAEWHRKPYIEKLDLKNVDSEIAGIMIKKQNLIKNKTISNSLKQEKLIKYDNLLRAYNNKKDLTLIKNRIDELKLEIRYINNKNMNESTKIQQLEKLNRKLESFNKSLNTILHEQEALLIGLNSLKNTSSNSYTWKKLKNKNGQLIKNNKGHFKWGKYTVKNKNNTPLPAGWTEYSNTNGTWYVSDFGDSTWNKPTENAKERIIETMPNTKLSGLSNNLSLANLASMGIYPNLAPPVIEQPVIEEVPSLNIVLDPSIKLLNSDARGQLPVGWKYYFKKGQKLYISSTGKIYDKRPILKTSKVNSIGKLPPGWSYVTDGYTSWYKRDIDGEIQQHRPD